MTDLEMSIRLARFMGWAEDRWPDRAAGITPVSTTWGIRLAEHPTHMDEVWTYPHTGGVKPWHPLLDPSQATLVMSEAARRGWLVETSSDPMASFSRPHTKAQVQTPESSKSGKGWFAVEDGVTAEAWCRAVCRAVLYTLDAIERKSAATDQERLERSV